MKKAILTLTVMLAAAALIAAFSGPASAAVSGVCSDCHTMHNSQGGTAMRTDDESAPMQTLLIGTCVGCHSAGAGTSIEAVTGAPIVYNTGAPGYGYNNEGLAAGNFYNCDTTAERVFGHNITDMGIGSQGIDSGITGGPPGFVAATKPAEFTQSGSAWGPTTWDNVGTTPVTCAGELGCHGDRSGGYDSYKGIKGAHHTNDGTIDGGTVGSSYRFLAGIKGVELNTSGYEWEVQADGTHHNGYQGDSSYGSDNTISYLCGECHGNFHAHTNLGGTDEVGSDSPWLRHPTDIELDASTSGVFTTDYTSYNVETPVALATPSTSTSTVDTTSIVMCLSCHRAHASPHTDILRFEYDMNAGDLADDGGCERCHQRQR
ncbi:MAG: hypothetical protein HWN69_03690 [Desulfobacterales bacterium]|nr:hypothetical protein [Desulfobacterales bacterium]